MSLEKLRLNLLARFCPMLGRSVVFFNAAMKSSISVKIQLCVILVPFIVVSLGLALGMLGALEGVFSLLPVFSGEPRRPTWTSYPLSYGLFELALASPWVHEKFLHGGDLKLIALNKEMIVVNLSWSGFLLITIFFTGIILASVATSISALGTKKLGSWIQTGTVSLANKLEEASEQSEAKLLALKEREMLEKLIESNGPINTNKKVQRL